MPYIGLILIIIISAAVLFRTYRGTSQLDIPILWSAGLGMLLLTSLAGPYLVGPDVHLEFFYARMYDGQEVMQQLTMTPQSTSLACYLAGWAPWSPMWTLKLVYPILFSLVPILLYCVFRKWVDTDKAFLGAFLFIIFPTFFMELPGLTRQMTAELAFAVALYLLVVRKSWWSLLAASVIPLFHYSIAVLYPVLLIPAAILVKGSRKVIFASIGVVILVSAIYFPLASEGAVYTKLAFLYNHWAPSVLELPVTPELVVPPTPAGMTVDLGPTTLPAPDVPFLQRYEAVVQSGLGLDFLQTSITGKIFRVLQWTIAVFAIVGIWKMKRSRWMYGGVLLLSLVVVPGFSSILNITRIVHIALFLLAPCVVIALKPKYMAPILIIYFAFTSGLVFEVSQQDNIEKITVPYNVGLSDYRIDLGAIETPDDVAVRQFVVQEKLFPVLSDIYGSDFMGEEVGWRDDLNAALFRDVYKVHDCYVFVRTRNVQDGVFTVWNGIGCRKVVEPADYGIDWNQNIIYQSGQARVIYVP